MKVDILKSSYRILLLSGSMVCCISGISADDASGISCWISPVPGSPVAYVDPFIGASTNMDRAGTYHGLGKTFPGATTPFGMVQVSPNTVTGGDNGSGYSHEHTTIEGFALTQMSGVGWYGDMGNFLMMPTVGKFCPVAGREDGRIAGYRSHYDKGSETAHPGYYSVHLTDYDIKVETSATPRCGIARFTFPESDTSRIQVDLARRVGGASTHQYVKVVNDSTLAGWMHCTPEGGGWGDGAGKVEYRLHFYARLSRPMEKVCLWRATIPEGTSRHLADIGSDAYMIAIRDSAEIIHGAYELEGDHIGFFAEYATSGHEAIEMKVGVSFVDMEGAKRNFMAEVDGRSFDDVHLDAVGMWEKALDKVRVKGGSDNERTAFYTALYHTMIDPRIVSDVDGRYVGADNAVHKSADGYVRRTVFSGWDVFRSQFPLQNIINPAVVSDEINSLIAIAEESGKGYFPRWELLNAYSGCMIGNPAIPVIADAYVKGIRTFDVEKALRYAVNSSDMFGTKALGYAPEPLSVSCTLEYAYADWCLSRLARACGDDSVASEFERRAQAYRNVFDESVGWFRPRKADGTWMPWNPDDSPLTREGYGCIESNLYQQGWFVPHDPEGMARLMGGKPAAISALDTLFSKTPGDMKWNAYYNHANEPVHFVPYIYNRLGAPWLTQLHTRDICRSAYGVGVEGLVGNEDVGQMSAWYVLSASGIHPSCPGESSLEITSPVFDEVEYCLDDRYHKGGKFRIIAHGNSHGNIYIDHALLNGRPYDKCRIDFDEISAGGVLELFMSPIPGLHWGTD
ncbi:GH92 family glycosyl hydrolase [uncultured Muribaculum sp.]|uniref:GH92 family glycosyl hydrolase n=1 Tax=uncultured Muribaculum sp. TaxID=1918613 RepID=UPI0025EE24DC|nr:GH92 family glycosyl hydrolase [uncultured Muribaculum sp.]